MRFSLFIIIILLLDQGSKQLLLRQTDLPWWLVEDRVGFQVVMNEGIAFSIPITGVASLVLSIIVLIAVLFYYFRYTRDHILTDICFGLIVGGAIGNIIDRFLYGKVVDFIHVYSYPSFNVADSAVVIGFLLLIIYFRRIQA